MGDLQNLEKTVHRETPSEYYNYAQARESQYSGCCSLIYLIDKLMIVIIEFIVSLFYIAQIV